MGFIVDTEPFDLMWRGTVLFAVHKNPIKFEKDVSYEFVAMTNKGEEITIPHQLDTRSNPKTYKQEMYLYDYAAGGNNDSANHWKSVTLKESYFGASTTVDVPKFLDTPLIDHFYKEFMQ
eukprot:140469_1